MEAYLKNWTMVSRKKYQLKEMLMIFQSIIVQLINLNFSINIDV